MIYVIKKDNKYVKDFTQVGCYEIKMTLTTKIHEALMYELKSEVLNAANLVNGDVVELSIKEKDEKSKN